MRRNDRSGARLTLRRETLRSLSRRDLARIAGGTYQQYDDGTDGVDPDYQPPVGGGWTQSQSLGTNSRFC